MREETAKAPGKLYIAGEYAVVEPGHAAILVAVDRYLTVNITPHAGVGGVIHSKNHPEASATWHRVNGRCQADGEPKGTAFVTSAINVVSTLAVERGIPLSGFDVAISSELDDTSGRKFGLGSSAAVTVAMVRALSAAYGLQLEVMELYKLAFLASTHAQRIGSGGDLAASLFGGCVLFHSPDRRWVCDRIAEVEQMTDSGGISHLIKQPWPGLALKRLPVFTSETSLLSRGSSGVFKLLVGWSGSPASTPELVGSVHSGTKPSAIEDYETFVSESDRRVMALASALLDQDMQAVSEQIAAARSLLHGLSQLTGTVIETPALHTLVEIALAHGAGAKSSGAGGGDCGIAIAGPDVDVEDLYAQWRTHGIEPLDLHVSAPLAD